MSDQGALQELNVLGNPLEPCGTDPVTGKTYDGNNDTGWYTESYSDGSFGGLKSGVGLVVDLGPNKKPQEVRLVIPNKSAVQVWIGPDARLEGATKIGEKDPAKGTVSFPVPEDVSGQYIILWYPKVYPDAKGDPLPHRRWWRAFTEYGNGIVGDMCIHMRRESENCPKLLAA